MADNELGKTYITILADLSQLRQGFVQAKSEATGAAQQMSAQFTNINKGINVGGGTGAGADPMGFKTATTNLRGLTHEMRGLSEVMRGMATGNPVDLLRGLTAISRGGLALGAVGMIGGAAAAGYFGYEYLTDRFHKEQQLDRTVRETEVTRKYDITGTAASRRVKDIEAAQAIFNESATTYTGAGMDELFQKLKKFAPLTAEDQKQWSLKAVESAGTGAKLDVEWMKNRLSELKSENMVEAKTEDIEEQVSTMFGTRNQQRKFKADVWKQQALDMYEKSIELGGGIVSPNEEIEAEAMIKRRAKEMARPETKVGTVTTAQGYWEMQQGAANKPDPGYWTKKLYDIVENHLIQGKKGEIPGTLPKLGPPIVEH